MKKALPFVLLALALAIAYLLYERWFNSGLKVTPEAERAIEDAKER